MLSSFRFAISATFSAEPLQSSISFWGRQLKVHFETRFSPYNQLLQSLLDPGSEFAKNAHGVNVILLRLEDLAHFDHDHPSTLDTIRTGVHDVLDALRDAPANLLSPVIVCLCPASSAFTAAPERARFVKETTRLIASTLAEVPGVQFLQSEEIRKRYPVTKWEEATGDRLGKIPYTTEYFAALGTALVRYAHSLFTAPYKVIVLDCDNTLWQGVCGEDGPQGITIDPPRRRLQEFMLEQREAGMLLCMASKNNEQDVLDVFSQHPEMPLQLHHFITWRINWESKADSLVSISDELSLGLDSFIFIDDSLKECAETSDRLPEVLTLALPEDIEETPQFLDHIWAFDRAIVTEEDRNRNAYYAQTQKFGNEIRKTTNLAEFIASLRLEVIVSPLTEEALPRAAQLTQRTNQFNFTTVRRSEADLQALLRNGSEECFIVQVSDRFGDYGIVGVLIFSQKEQDLIVDTFLLSCRVLGRGVEHRVMAWLGEVARGGGVPFVTVAFEATNKNRPAQQFLESLGPDLRFRSTDLANLEWKPPSTGGNSQPAASKQPATRAGFRSLDFTRIAATLSDPAKILEEISTANGAGAHANSSMTGTEQKLAVIWAELLERSSVTATDNFFDLGGHSLLAVLLLLRIKETFGVELPIDDVYSGSLTLADLATRIEMFRMGNVDSAEYERLLQEIEGLSEEEVQALLAAETSSNPPSSEPRP